VRQALLFFRTRAGAVWAAGAVAVIALILLTVPLAALFRNQATEIDTAEQELGRLQAEESAAGTLRQQLLELNRRTSALPGLFHGKSLAAAQTDLQQTIESIAASAKASIRSTQMLPPVRAGAFDVVEIQYDVTAPASRLGDLTYALESRAPFLFLRNVQIAGGGSWQSGTTEKGQDVQLNIRWTMRGYRARGGR
jgi:hypothetical protein